MKQMKFSVIIPVAPDRGAEVIQSLKNLKLPKYNYEVIVERGRNPSRNRNVGARKAVGEILCFLDDDAVVDENLLSNAWDLFEANPDVSIAGGPQLTPKDDKYFPAACGEVLASYFGSMSMSKRYKKGKADFDADENSLTSAVMFVRAEAFKAIGGFNESLFPAEDPEFLSRAKRKGFRIAYSPELVIYHRRRPTLIGFIEQFFNYGKSRVKKEKICGTKPGLMFWIPPIFAAYVSLLFLGIMLGAAVPMMVIFPLLAYFAIAITVSAYIAAAKRINSKEKPIKPLIYYGGYVFLLPLLFFCVHYFYGLGVIEASFESGMEKKTEMDKLLESAHNDGKSKSKSGVGKGNSLTEYYSL